MGRGGKRPSSPQPSPPSGEEREKSAMGGSWSQCALNPAWRLSMNREKPDAEGTVSPLTPALSPLRGEGESAARSFSASPRFMGSMRESMSVRDALQKSGLNE